MIESIDVVILAWNEEESIARAVGDVHDALGPTGVDHHVVVVDDGSTDSTLRVATHLAVRDPRLTVRSHVENRGMGAAIRTGIEAGTREYVTVLPADRQIRADVLPGMMRAAGPGIVVTSVYANRPNDAVRTFVSRGFRMLLTAAIGPTPPLEGTWIAPRDLLEEIDLVSDTFTISFEMLRRARERDYGFRTLTIESHTREQGTSRVFNPGRIARVFGEVVRLGRAVRR